MILVSEVGLGLLVRRDVLGAQGVLVYEDAPAAQAGQEAREGRGLQDRQAGLEQLVVEVSRAVLVELALLVTAV